MNSFNKTEAAIFSMQSMLPEDSPLSLYYFNLPQLVFSACVVAVKCRPFLIIVYLYFSDPLGYH